MNKILSSLSEYQAEAFSRCIDFDIDVHFDHDGEPTIDVKLYYCVTGYTVETRLLTTKFTKTSRSAELLNRIKEFIDTSTVSFNKTEE